ncbi:MAG TPA: polysaccharide biosynthesis/export family protein [Flavobacterium sp.]|nr:polysaccharide biosynthesis/export family protein [Flavobacterium sp.]
MNKPFIYILLFAGLFFTSCVPTKDLVYLQNKENKDSVQAVNPVASKPYRLQTNDIINVSIKAIDPKLVEMFSIFSEAQQMGQSEQTLYFNGYTVDDHGNIRIPVLKEINVLGFTLEEVRAKVESQLLADYFKQEANIFVTVKLAGFRYTINGEVGSPGSKILFQEKANIMEAIANAGDITTTGDRKKVAVIRQFPQGTEIHTIDLTDIKAMQSSYYYLQPNDYIYVKPLPQKAWGTGTTGLQSFTTIISVLTLVTTTILLLTQN